MTATTRILVGTPDPAVALDGDELLVRDLPVRDHEVVAAARRHLLVHPDADLAPWVASTLSLGARTLGLASGALDDAALELRLDGFATRVDASAAEAVRRVEGVVAAATDPERGAVARTVASALGRLSADVAGLVAGEDGPVRRAVDEALARATGATQDAVSRQLSAQTELVRAALGSEDPSSPFAVLAREIRATGDHTRGELLRHMVDLRAGVEGLRAHREMVPKTSGLQGASYEDAVLAALTDVAGGLQDTVDATGASVGRLPGCKVGDGVVTVADRTTGGVVVRLAVEAKAQHLTSDKWKRECEAARRNRGAHACLAVVRGVGRMPGRSRSVFVLDPSNVIVSWTEDEPTDLLAASYQLVRASAVADALRETGHAHVDAARLEAALRDALEALAGFDALFRAEAAARRGLDELRRAAQELRTQLERRLARGLGGEGQLGA